MMPLHEQMIFARKTTFNSVRGYTIEGFISMLCGIVVIVSRVLKLHTEFAVKSPETLKTPQYGRITSYGGYLVVTIGYRAL